MSTDEYSKRFYKNNAQKYTEHVRNPKDSVYHAYYEKPAMYGQLPDLTDKDVISIGCGSGEDSMYLKKQGAKRSVGIDLTKELIEIAEQSYPECEFQVMDMELLNFPANSFDFAYSSLAIHYVEDWENVFKRVYNTLKPNSYFLFSCAHPVRFAMDNNKLEMTKDAVTGKRIYVGDYLAKRRTLDSLGKDTANTWSMPFGDISLAIKNSGFLIEQIIDPRPLEELKEINLDAYERLSKVPEFVIFKLIKF